MSVRRAAQTYEDESPCTDVRGPFEFWTGGLSGALAGFILTWTLFYGLIRA